MNWAGRLLDLGRPADVLKVLDGIDRDYTTPYGEAWIDSQRTCAQNDLDPKLAEPMLEALRKQLENKYARRRVPWNHLVTVDRLVVAAGGVARHVDEKEV